MLLCLNHGNFNHILSLSTHPIKGWVEEGYNIHHRASQPATRPASQWDRLLVRAECVRQRNEVAIKLGIISPPPLLSLRAFCYEQTWSVIG